MTCVLLSHLQRGFLLYQMGINTGTCSQTLRGRGGGEKERTLGTHFSKLDAIKSFPLRTQGTS